MTTAFWIFAAFAFALGAVVGSFLNVVIHRLPEGRSIVSPASRCPRCAASIHWYHNIPVVSWLALGGRCHDCDGPISARYPLVEILVGAMSLGLWWKAARPHFEVAAVPAQLPLPALLIPFATHLVFVALATALAAIDFDHYIVPHSLTLPGIAVGLLHPWLVDWFVRPGFYRFWPPVTWYESLLGAVAGAAAVAVIYYGYLALRGVEGLGGGDLTLMAFVGAWLGWPALPFVFFAASLQGLVAAVGSRLADAGWLRTKADIYGGDGGDGPDDAPGRLAVPFGPFIILAALEQLFLGPYFPPILSASYFYAMWAP